MLYFILGLIVGILVNPIKRRLIHYYEHSPRSPITGKEKTQFVEPVTFKEKFNNADNISELIEE